MIDSKSPKYSEELAKIEKTAENAMLICRVMSEILITKTTEPLALSDLGRDGLRVLFGLLEEKNTDILEATECLHQKMGGQDE